MNETPRPTDAELDILGVLWRDGAATVRAVHEQLAPSRGTGYTTTLKLMQLMAAKGLLWRDDRERSHVYRAAIKPEPAQRRILGRLIEQIFAGSTRAMVQQALDAGKVSPAELAEIRQLIAEYPGTDSNPARAAKSPKKASPSRSSAPERCRRKRACSTRVCARGATVLRTSSM